MKLASILPKGVAPFLVSITSQSMWNLARLSLIHYDFVHPTPKLHLTPGYSENSLMMTQNHRNLKTVIKFCK